MIFSWSDPIVGWCICRCSKWCFTWMLRNRKWFCNRALCFQPQETQIHTCSSRRSPDMSLELPTPRVSTLCLCVCGIFISFWKRISSEERGEVPSYFHMDWSSQISTGMDLEKQHWNSTLQMEIPHFKRLNWGVMISSEERIVCYVRSSQAKRSKDEREFVIICCRELKIEKYLSPLKYNESS